MSRPAGDLIGFITQASHASLGPGKNIQSAFLNTIITQLITIIIQSPPFGEPHVDMVYEAVTSTGAHPSTISHAISDSLVASFFDRSRPVCEIVRTVCSSWRAKLLASRDCLYGPQIINEPRFYHNPETLSSIHHHLGIPAHISKSICDSICTGVIAVEPPKSDYVLNSRRKWVHKDRKLSPTGSESDFVGSTPEHIVYQGEAYYPYPGSPSEGVPDKENAPPEAGARNSSWDIYGGFGDGNSPTPKYLTDIDTPSYNYDRVATQFYPPASPTLATAVVSSTSTLAAPQPAATYDYYSPPSTPTSTIEYSLSPAPLPGSPAHYPPSTPTSPIAGYLNLGTLDNMVSDEPTPAFQHIQWVPPLESPSASLKMRARCDPESYIQYHLLDSIFDDDQSQWDPTPEELDEAWGKYIEPAKASLDNTNQGGLLSDITPIGTLVEWAKMPTSFSSPIAGAKLSPLIKHSTYTTRVDSRMPSHSQVSVRAQRPTTTKTRMASTTPTRRAVLALPCGADQARPGSTNPICQPQAACSKQQPAISWQQSAGIKQRAGNKQQAAHSNHSDLLHPYQPCLTANMRPCAHADPVECDPNSVHFNPNKLLTTNHKQQSASSKQQKAGKKQQAAHSNHSNLLHPSQPYLTANMRPCAHADPVKCDPNSVHSNTNLVHPEIDNTNVCNNYSLYSNTTLSPNEINYTKCKQKVGGRRRIFSGLTIEMGDTHSHAIENRFNLAASHYHTLVPALVTDFEDTEPIRTPPRPRNAGDHPMCGGDQSRVSPSHMEMRPYFMSIYHQRSKAAVIIQRFFRQAASRYAITRQNCLPSLHENIIYLARQTTLIRLYTITKTRGQQNRSLLIISQRNWSSKLISACLKIQDCYRKHFEHSRSIILQSTQASHWSTAMAEEHSNIFYQGAFTTVTPDSPPLTTDHVAKTPKWFRAGDRLSAGDHLATENIHRSQRGNPLSSRPDVTAAPPTSDPTKCAPEYHFQACTTDIYPSNTPPQSEVHNPPSLHLHTV